MSKKLCKQGIDSKIKKGKTASFQCKRCGRLAGKEKHLCKPKNI